MKTLPHLNVLFLSILSTGFVLCGCHGNQQQVSANSATQADQPSNDPATANLAPVAEPAAQGSNGSYAPSSDEYAGE